MNCETCHLPTQFEDFPVSTILGTLSALEALCDYALYKSTIHLHLRETGLYSVVAVYRMTDE